MRIFSLLYIPRTKILEHMRIFVFAIVLFQDATAPTSSSTYCISDGIEFLLHKFVLRCEAFYRNFLLLTTFSSVLQTQCGGYFHRSQNWAVDMTAVACGEDRSNRWLVSLILFDYSFCSLFPFIDCLDLPHHVYSYSYNRNLVSRYNNV
jgi:hypothetical protein